MWNDEKQGSANVGRLTRGKPRNWRKLCREKAWQVTFRALPERLCDRRSKISNWRRPNFNLSKTLLWIFCKSPVLDGPESIKADKETVDTDPAFWVEGTQATPTRHKSDDVWCRSVFAPGWDGQNNAKHTVVPLELKAHHQCTLCSRPLLLFILSTLWCIEALSVC